jgi:hypothetical protein
VFSPHWQCWRQPLQVRKSWEFALAATGTCIGTAFSVQRERSLHMAKMSAALIVAAIAARIEAMIERRSLNATIAEMDRRRSTKSTWRKMMGLAEYMVVAQGDEWGVLHDGSINNRYATKESAFEAAVAAASLAIREGHEVHLSVPDRSAGNQTALGAKDQS